MKNGYEGTPGMPKLAAVPGLRFLESRRTLPFVDGVDGAFAAKFSRG